MKGWDNGAVTVDLGADVGGGVPLNPGASNWNWASEAACKGLLSMFVCVFDLHVYRQELVESFLEGPEYL